MKTYKEQQEEKGLVFVPFPVSMYFYLHVSALNPNQKIDYYEVAGTWKTPKEIQKEKLKHVIIVISITIVVGLLISALIYV